MLHNGKTARPGKAGGSTLMISLMVIVIFGAFAYALQFAYVRKGCASRLFGTGNGNL